MDTLTVTFKGASAYFDNPTMVEAVQSATRWDKPKAIHFIKRNETILFKKYTPEKAKALLQFLESGGFQLQVTTVKDGITVEFEYVGSHEVEQLREEMALLRKRIEHIEKVQNVSPPEEEPQQKPATAPYEELIDAYMDSNETTDKVPSSNRFLNDLKVKAKPSTESNIGQYWLSRIGIVTLLIGITFFISYTSKNMSALGKLMIAGMVGVGIVVGGNILARKEKYFKWAMTAMGGGWAVLYFTVFAAHHVPVVKVIANPFLGLVLLMGVALMSIVQALQHRSYALVFSSYFLAYFAMTTTHVTFYTLFASALLAISMLLISRGLKWSWLAVMGLVMVYLTHFIWLSPSITWGAEAHVGQSKFYDAFYLPWMGASWRIYPLLSAYQSQLHLSFLTLYAVLFSGVDLLQPKEQRKDDEITPWVSVANGCVFTLSFIHHLHVYYPQWKCLATLVLAGLFLAMSFREKRIPRKLFSDVYLGMGISLLCLVIPMTFDGITITVGWALAAVVLVKVGVKYQSALMRYIACALCVFVFVRILGDDYRLQDPIFQNLPLNPFFFVCLYSAFSFVVFDFIYQKATDAKKDEKDLISNLVWITAASFACFAIVMGGLKAFASIFILGFGAGLMYRGIKVEQMAQRMAAGIILLFAAMRFFTVDLNIAWDQFTVSAVYMLRHILGALSIFAFMCLAEKLRPIAFKNEIEKSYVIVFSVTAAILYLQFVDDKMTEDYLTVLWGVGAISFLIFGFMKKEAVYRWIGLVGFALVLLRLFFHDLKELEQIYRILSFIGLGIVLIGASFIYTHFAKTLLDEKGDSKET